MRPRRVNPNDDRVYDLFARIMMQQRKHAVAARIYAEAARLNPADSQYLLAEGTALVEQASSINSSQSKAAADERTFVFTRSRKGAHGGFAFEQATQADVHLQLARIYEKRGERPRAASELEQYLRKAQNVKNPEAIRQAIKTLRGAPAKG